MNINKLTTDQVNYLNVLLMIVSGLLAFRWPFETFLFAYAFFGPLHYLTEISWLHDRQYFTRRKYDWMALVLAGVLVTIIGFSLIPDIPQSVATIVTIVAFVAALVFVVADSIPIRILAIVLTALLATQIATIEPIGNIFGIFLPTLIHVFIFTGLFILVGALRGRSFSGILSLVVFVGIAAAFFLLHPSAYHVSDYVRNSYGVANEKGFSSGFMMLNYEVLHGFNLHDFGRPSTLADVPTFIQNINAFLYQNPVALSLMAFISFAYLYHYLNWFSKTSVIRWHNISRKRFAFVIAIWIISLGIYAYDYNVGFEWLFFLSFTHVLLELPLNHITFMNITKEIGTITRLRKVPA